jgi:hypothetical protein
MKIFFLSSHLDFFPENCGSVTSTVNISTRTLQQWRGRYKGKWTPSVLADYCWTLMRDSPNSMINQQAKKARLH